jgi:soluble lytic murein transglycosylase
MFATRMELMKKIISVIAAIALIITLAVCWQYGYNSFLKLAYPVKYSDIVIKYSAQLSVSPTLIYAVIKNESGFNPKAKSSIGALGLMQVTPETFEWAQSKTPEIENYTDNDLLNPEINIKYGTLVLSILINEFKNTDTALAAYHAGRTNVKNWLLNSDYSQDGQTLTHIPFADTRGYVPKVIAAEKIYSQLYKLEE